ncbi:MAG: 23S rRNA (uracil(1939)-C(5))-methyltransferase RlmD [Verrucomicrobia bacterium]|nr:23S rRNA (uracil(1939)-C(5))-methyltransferase RlmD [Verrucomicrobiota bacterium]
MIEGCIESIAFGGEGVLRHEGMVIFVPFTAPGDHVRIEITEKKKNFARGRLLNILRPGPGRTQPCCKHFGTCGGCQFQHLSYATQLEIKQKFLQDALKRIGKIEVEVPPLIPAQSNWHYRRHIRLSLNPSKGYFQAAYAHLNTVEECPIFTENKAFFPALESTLVSLSSAGIERGSVRILKKHSQFQLIFECIPQLPKQSKSWAESVIRRIPEIAGIGFFSPRDEALIGDLSCEIEELGLKVRYSPRGFVQNHPEMATHLYQAILAAIPSTAGTIADFYCGIGITSLLLAKTGRRVIGIEMAADTIAAAKKNAEINQVHTIEFVEGKAESIAKNVFESNPIDAVLCNPPRTGMDPLLTDLLIEKRPQTLLYVSCMPATLSRDLSKLQQGGYEMERIQAFDMFPQTTHLETLAIMRDCLRN